MYDCIDWESNPGPVELLVMATADFTTKPPMLVSEGKLFTVNYIDKIRGRR